MRGLCVLLCMLLLTGCSVETVEIPAETMAESTGTSEETEVISETEAEIEPETVVETEVIPETEAETVPETVAETEILAETVKETEVETEAPPLVCPDGMLTDITDADAGEILEEIAGIVLDWDAAVYYTMPDTGGFFSVNGDRKYHSASTVKAVYCQYLLESGVDLSGEITLYGVSRSSTSGMLTDASAGQSFKVADLIEYTIRQSDNQAYRLLYETYGWEGFNLYTESVGIPGVTLDGADEWAMVNAEELSLAMTEIYRTSAAGDTLIEHLKNTDYNAQIPRGTAYETAHKYGYNGGRDGYHDTAIVYAPGGVYVLTILSNAAFEDETSPNLLFRSVAALCDDLSETLAENGNRSVKP